MGCIFDHGAAFAKAFSPLTEPVVWSRHNSPHQRGTIPAVVLETGNDDPTDEIHADSDRRMFAINIDAKDWPYGFDPAVGDSLTIPSLRNTVVNISDVSYSTGAWNLTAREGKPAK